MKFSGIALLGAATLAVAQHQHQHQHLHAGRHLGSPAKRDLVSTTTTVTGPVETVYELDGKLMSWAEVQAGIKDGKYVIEGETISTVVPAPSSTSTPTSSSLSTQAAQFYQKPSSSSSTSTTTSSSAAPTSTYVAPTTSASSVAVASSSPAPASSSSSSGSSGIAADINAEFPSGTIDCTSFPSQYGPVPLDYIGLGGWIGGQKCPDYNPLSAAISYIESLVSGSSIQSNTFLSYACPAGYQKSQWPEAQGATGQSIGGLLCNSEGKLELTRPSVPQLCILGAGGVEVTNNLGDNVCICRTDYPGLEAETVPLDALPGTTKPLCNPDSSTYYSWEGKATTAQYYVNPNGVSCDKACMWGEAGTNIGNWAPVNLGVGKATTGITYISLFPNSPTNPDGKLDYTISITGGSGSCKYSGGTYYSNGVESPTGCTVGVTGEAEVVLS